MTWLVRTEKELVSQWVGCLLKGMEFAGAYSIGVMDGNKIIAGVVYNNFFLDCKKKPLSIEMTIASIDRKWCSRYNLNEFFAYPFIYLDVKRVTATCSRKDTETRAFLKRLGFRLEGIGRKAWFRGGDSAAYSMLKKECKWIKNEQGQFGTSSTRPIRNRKRTERGEQGNSAMEQLS